MPTISIHVNEFHRRFGKLLSVEEFEDLCFSYGLEYDGQETNDDGSLSYRVEVPANRIDLLCVEGITRAFKIFNNTMEYPIYKLNPMNPSNNLKMIVKASTSSIRPYCFCAILRGVVFTELNYKSFIELQDKLHQNISRRRQLAAIGTHDLSKLTGPFTYEACPPKSIRFIPLNQSKEVDGNGMIELLSTHTQLKAYLPIISSSPVFPVIRDAAGTVLSVPPIINSDYSKITLNTRDVFIEVTAKDRTKGGSVLAALVSIFSEYAAVPFTIEPVKVEYEQGHPELGGCSFINPSLETVQFETSVEYLQTITGITDLTTSYACQLLNRMMVGAYPVNNNSDKIIAVCPITRPDILHPCDLAEDVAIAYGYNNIKSKKFLSVTEQPYMVLSNQVRSELANCGYHEALTWGLCSLREGFEFLRWKCRDVTESNPRNYEHDPLGRPVQLSNPKTKEFEMVRTSLIPGLLKTLAANKAQELPLRLFEIGDCVCIDPSTDTGARTHRYCAALIANSAGSGLEAIHGLLDVILAKLSLIPEYHELQATRPTTHNTEVERIYKLELTHDNEAFLPGRCVNIKVHPGNVALGIMGVLHPSVLKSFNTTLPCSVFEFTLEPFLSWLPESNLFLE